eukprot:CAMPEP_0206219340 /NCGR_PEP_ID=MMETSP0047_2-20121206/4268_1 /ASSEMBLY_ACC=CAM_ASM_000192 /TAXON_ID=195065 /ORGANISM="Chroomonas mesostigmatica_cf, Strain CCMP1168" /LENGTH=247 /DNA_ID=CAMNT_0053641879 /DNA_START=117 /DNA_END=860 /DNA_ORIENTATION=-
MPAEDSLPSLHGATGLPDDDGAPPQRSAAAPSPLLHDMTASLSSPPGRATTEHPSGSTSSVHARRVVLGSFDGLGTMGAPSMAHSSVLSWPQIDEQLITEEHGLLGGRAESSDRKVLVLEHILAILGASIHPPGPGAGKASGWENRRDGEGHAAHQLGRCADDVHALHSGAEQARVSDLFALLGHLPLHQHNLHHPALPAPALDQDPNAHALRVPLHPTRAQKRHYKRRHREPWHQRLRAVPLRRAP